jgi:hypothetical protein
MTGLSDGAQLHLSHFKGRLRLFGGAATRLGSFSRKGEGQDEGKKKRVFFYEPLTLTLSRRERELLRSKRPKLGPVS